MATEKITITDQLRNNIIEERKEIEYTASDLSEESGHSKYWLANIESGKTKKISKEDLISIYKILLDDDDEENILDYVERIINQPIAGKIKNWYELIDIEDQYEDMLDFLYLESELDDLLKDIRNRITQQFNWANTHHQQAILTSLLHFQRSIVVNPELAFSTLYLPTYCTSIMHPEEFNSVLSDLLQLAAKFNDLVVKNNSLETVAVYLEEEKKQKERNKKTLSVFGFSKSFGVAGLRIGCIYAQDKEFFDKIVDQSYVMTTAGGIASISQIAGIACLEKTEYWVKEFLEHLKSNRDYALERLNKMPGITCHKPYACYLLFPDITGTGKSSQEFADFMMENARLAIVPGTDKFFGPGAEGHVRICIATSREILEEGLNRLEKGLQMMK